MKSGLFDLVQIEWNLLNQSVLNAVQDLAAMHNVKIALRSIFLQGVLTSKGNNLPNDLSGLILPRAHAVDLAQEIGMPLNALALRAALDNGAASYVLVGPDHVSQLEEIIEHAKLKELNADNLKSIEKLNIDNCRLVDPRSWQK